MAIVLIKILEGFCNFWMKLKVWIYDISNFDKIWEITQLENENLKVSSRKSNQSVYVVPTQHKKRIKLNVNSLMQYARIDTALQPLHTCFFVTLFFTHVFSSVLMFQIRYENHGLPISWVSQKMSSEESIKKFHLHIWPTALNFTLCILAEGWYYGSKIHFSCH